MEPFVFACGVLFGVFLGFLFGFRAGWMRAKWQGGGK